MLRISAAIAALALIASPSLSANCRDAKGKFVKCPTAASGTAAGVVKDAKGKCHFASGPKKGQFTKCR